MALPTPLHPDTDVDKPVELHRLCEECSQICGHAHRLIKEYYEGQKIAASSCTFAHHESGDSLVLSAQDGCHLCRLIIEAIANPAEDVTVKGRLCYRRFAATTKQLFIQGVPKYNIELSAFSPSVSSNRGPEAKSILRNIREKLPLNKNRQNWSVSVDIKPSLIIRFPEQAASYQRNDSSDEKSKSGCSWTQREIELAIEQRKGVSPSSYTRTH